MPLPINFIFLFCAHGYSIWEPTQFGSSSDATTGLGRMDYVIQQAQVAGIKLILTLNNNWSDYG